MSAHRKEFLDLCAGYVLGSLSDGDRRALEEHLATGCPQCEAELKRVGGEAASAAASGRPGPPPSGRVIALPKPPAREPSRPLGGLRRPPIPLHARRVHRQAARLWAIAAAALALAALVTWRLEVAVRDDLVTARRQLQEERRWSALPAAPRVRIVALEPAAAGATGLRGRALYDPETRRALLVFENAALPQGADYEVWALTAEGASSLRLVRPDADGRAVLRLENAGDPARLDGFAVSREREGGSPSSIRPEGPLVLVGRLPGR